MSVTDTERGIEPATPPQVGGVSATGRRADGQRTRRRRRKFPRFWHPPLEEGTYSKIPTWGSRDRWLSAVKAGAEAKAWTPKRRRTLLAVATVLSDHADGRTGRNVCVAKATIAKAVGVDVRTVQRYRRDLEELGLVVTVDEGRHLFNAERVAAYEATDRVMIRKTTTRALVLPRTAVENVAPPTASAVGLKLTPVDGTNARRARRKSEASTTSPRPVALQRLAGRLAARWGWLVRGRHIGALCTALERTGVDPNAWTASDVVAAIDGWHQRHRRTSLAMTSDNPLAWLTWALRAAIADGYAPRDYAAEKTARDRRAAQHTAEVTATVDTQTNEAAVEALRIARAASSEYAARRLAAA